MGTYNVEVQGKLNNGDSNNCNKTIVYINTIEDAPEPKINKIEATERNTIYLNYDPLYPIFEYSLEVDLAMDLKKLPL